jgi:hypothetical protein
LPAAVLAVPDRSCLPGVPTGRALTPGWERVAAMPATAPLSHIRPWRLRVKGSGQRILDERSVPAGADKML